MRLTARQRAFLGEISNGGIHCLDMPWRRVSMAEQMARDGLVERYFRGFGQWGYRITDLGRQALNPNSGGERE